MQIYTVGGAVRDELLGLAVTDRDYVVVGATPSEMIERGFRPVGKDFPVFLHPQTHEEYALARTERKTAPGYAGFVFHAEPGVTLEQDLARRDLTINAIARAEDGALIDPHGGVADLTARVLRHVGPAFVEDPLRILRVARFAARFHDFEVAGATLALMRQIVDSGEVNHLVAERLWQELARGLMEAKPSRMFEVLRACGALAVILPEVDRLFGVPQPPQSHPEIDTGVHLMLVIDHAAARQYPLPVRYAALTHDLGKGLTPQAQWPQHPGHEEQGAALVTQLSERIRATNDCRDLALLAARYHGEIHRASELSVGDAEAAVTLLERCDALRRPQRFADLLDACASDFHGRSGYESRPYPQRDRLLAVQRAMQQVDAGAIAGQTPDPAQIPSRVHEARVAATQALFGKY